MDWPRRFVLACAAGALCAATVAAQSRPPAPAQEVSSPQVLPPASDVAGALQRKYDSIKDFTASFTQAYEGGVLRRKASESGTVSVKKPGKMRWDYTSPEKKLFVSDGQTMFLYFPNEKQVMKNAVPGQDQATSAVLFLMGKGNITRDFNVRWAEGGSDTTYRLRLDPKTRQTEYRLARNHRRPRVPAHRRIDGGRRPGGQILVHFQQCQGKRGTGR